MDRRSWPWKKKSSDKADKAAAASEAPVATASQKQDSYKKPRYVQISVEQYTSLTGLEEQIKTYEEQVDTYIEQIKTYEDHVQTYEEQVQTYEDQVQNLKEQIKGLNEKLSAAHAEIAAKEHLVKQHSKVAEDAVSGWEKAEAEALALKSTLESVTLSKLTAEDQAAHLDGAIKECMWQIRKLKEEHEQTLQDIVLTKTKQMDKLKLEFERKASEFEQELLRSAADNDTLSRTLQDRSNMLVKISEEKSRAEAEIELLKCNIESCGRDINSLKYELHVVSKELEIRNEEKNMSVRSAEAANKQNMESMKKIVKLEAECQRLRGLVRKKLPGPAALAQMKLEVESLGKDYGETRLKRSPRKSSSPHLSPKGHSSPVSDFAFENAQKFQKENDFLTERLLAMEEEMKMLKEALAKRNSELQESRNLCAQTTCRLESLEAQHQQKNPQKFNPEIYSSRNASNPLSTTSTSEDGNDNSGSCAESSSTTPSQAKKDKDTEKLANDESVKRLELMDDFLEMEKLACLPNDSNAYQSTDVKDSSNDKKLDTVNVDAYMKLQKQYDADQPPVMRLRSRISEILESISIDGDVEKLLADIKCITQDVHDTLNQHKRSNTVCNGEDQNVDGGLNTERDIISKELATAVSRIHDFLLFLGKEATGADDTFSLGKGFGNRINKFSVAFNKVLCNQKNLVDFLSDLSHVLTEAGELKINVMGFKGTEEEIPSPDCIDKIALPESRVIRKDSSGENYLNGCAHISDSEVPPHDGNIVSGFETSTRSCNVTLEEFEELKSGKEKIAMDLEGMKSQLHETEQLLADVKSRLASAEMSKSLAETQLKCMTESYRLLEARAAFLETELNRLHEKIENLENELEDEKRSHEDALVRCKELEEQLLRNEEISSAAADDDLKTKEEKELTAAAKKLAECQETIFLLGKQLKSLCPQPDQIGSPCSERRQTNKRFLEDEPCSTISGKNPLDSDQTETDTATSDNEIAKYFGSPQSPTHTETSQLMRSPIGSKNASVRHTRSGSSSCSSGTPTPEKPSRGFSRFFSAK